MYAVAAVHSSDHSASEGWYNTPLSHKHFFCTDVLLVEHSQCDEIIPEQLLTFSLLLKDTLAASEQTTNLLINRCSTCSTTYSCNINVITFELSTT